MSKKHKIAKYCFNNLGAIEKYLDRLHMYTNNMEQVIDYVILNEDEIKDAYKAISLIRRKIKECHNVKHPEDLNDIIRVKRAVESNFYKFEDGD